MDEFGPKAYVDARLLDQRYCNEQLRQADRDYVNMRFEEQGKATKVALDAANEKGIQHNGTLDMLKTWMRTTVTWPVAMACLVSGGIVVGIYETFTG